MTRSLDDLKSQVRHQALGNGQLVNTILKEFLHQYILASIQQSPLARKLVFQGGTVVLNVSSEQEILTDKLVAVAARRFLKPRDIWDIKWLKDKNISPHPEWLAKKVDDYHLDSLDWLRERLQSRSEEMLEEPFRKKFREEMKRFLDRDQAQIWLQDEAMCQALLEDVSDYISTVEV